MSQTGSSFNFYRKAWHLLGLIVPLFVYIDPVAMIWPDLKHGSRWVGVGLLASGTLFLVIVDSIRLANPSFNRFFINLVGPLMKEEERDRYNGTVPYLFANLLLYLFFSKEIVVLSCLFLMIGDPAAAYFGMRFGKTRFFNGKSLEGALGFIFAGFLACAGFLFLHAHFQSESSVFWLYGGSAGPGWWWLGILLLSSVGAGIAEFFSVTGFRGLIDDNLIVPLAGCLTLALLGHAAGLPWSDVLFNPGKLAY
ncbi:MAG: dolichol kinase [Leptospiraceae bacterium]|nr:dolichol kinase [Leptospiraceae bacterium]